MKKSKKIALIIVFIVVICAVGLFVIMKERQSFVHDSDTAVTGNVDNVNISDWKPSELYTDADIEAAIQVIKDYFSEEFSDCTLTDIGYVGDTFSDEFVEWAEQYGSDEAIILTSTFNVGPSGGDGSLEPDKYIQ
ncbi:MAG: hypothetical protein LUF92_15210 [Clostridiales bacterium]|nr:hypothetical protein [Clostridiales bacterium]